MSWVYLYIPDFILTPSFIYFLIVLSLTKDKTLRTPFFSFFIATGTEYVHFSQQLIGKSRNLRNSHRDYAHSNEQSYMASERVVDTDHPTGLGNQN